MSLVLTEFREKNIFGGLDGLRFISIVAVVWHHAVEGGEWLHLVSRGFLGVDLFFVISGFLIVTLLLRERDKTGDISLKKFYMRRSLRIFPLYYGFILGLALLYFLFKKDSDFGQSFISELPIYLFYLANFFPVSFAIVWSLASEEQFYLVWPFLEKYFVNFIPLILIGFIAINQVINFFREPLFTFLGLEHLIELSIMQSTFTPILLGVLLAHVLHKGTWLVTLIDKKYSSLAWFLILLVVIEISPPDISGFPRLIMQILMMLVVGSTVIREDNYFNHVLCIKPLARIGAISYGVYLFHIHGIAIAEKLLEKAGFSHDMILFGLSLLITVILAELSYRYFETFFLKLKSRFSVVHQKHP